MNIILDDVEGPSILMAARHLVPELAVDGEEAHQVREGLLHLHGGVADSIAELAAGRVCVGTAEEDARNFNQAVAEEEDLAGDAEGVRERDDGGANGIDGHVLVVSNDDANKHDAKAAKDTAKNEILLHRGFYAGGEGEVAGILVDLGKRENRPGERLSESVGGLPHGCERLQVVVAGDGLRLYGCEEGMHI